MAIKRIPDGNAVLMLEQRGDGWIWMARSDLLPTRDAAKEEAERWFGPILSRKPVQGYEPGIPDSEMPRHESKD